VLLSKFKEFVKAWLVPRNVTERILKSLMFLDFFNPETVHGRWVEP